MLFIDNEQLKILQRREYRRAGADDDAGATAARLAPGRQSFRVT